MRASASVSSRPVCSASARSAAALRTGDGGGRLHPLAFSLQLGGKEIQPRVGRIGAAGRVQRAGHGAEVLGEERLLGPGEQLLGRARETLARLRVARVPQQHGPVEFDGVLALGLRQPALRQGDAGGSEQPREVGGPLPGGGSGPA